MISRSWESQWNSVFEAAPLETIEEKGAYSIRSKVLYEFGIKWKTASAVSVASAGASFSLNAQANLDISNGVGPTVQSKKGWEPQVTYSYPVFTTEFAGNFCTSYLDYRPPRTTSISIATSTSGSTTTTEYVTSWVPAKAQYVVVTISSYSDGTGWPQWDARTIITIERTATFDHSGLKRRDATATQQLAARAVYTPGLVQDWDSKKISFACEQIATGTETVTQPVTTTIGVGTVTVTATTTVDRPGGDVKFYTENSY
ncbi:hypothetical protein FOC1_g10007032 [Fusarium oxysporum f. sp. cubense race 1]|uniref:Uncharacterized protein n=1 Tax=Fusarium oxysporum f. sp. cubense (strain race 1) TaxID=1229664 RepID=N4U782_FUSC1|nr:hypothetical protein FOC1_g10007032 [Fusarium oxysporum f. sp. cubense race 1]